MHLDSAWVCDANDCDALGGDPLFELAVGRTLESGRDPYSQPNMSWLEDGPSRSEVVESCGNQQNSTSRTLKTARDLIDVRAAVDGEKTLSRSVEA